METPVLHFSDAVKQVEKDMLLTAHPYVSDIPREAEGEESEQKEEDEIEEEDEMEEDELEEEDDTEGGGDESEEKVEEVEHLLDWM